MCERFASGPPTTASVQNTPNTPTCRPIERPFFAASVRVDCTKNIQTGCEQERE